MSAPFALLEAADSDFARRHRVLLFDPRASTSPAKPGPSYDSGS
jgi:hypothetical protein